MQEGVRDESLPAAEAPARTREPDRTVCTERDAECVSLKVHDITKLSVSIITAISPTSPVISN